MHRFKRIVASIAATGFAAFGMVAAAGGVASAATTNTSVTGCSIPGDAIGWNASPECIAGTSTVFNPTSIKIVVDPSWFTDLGTDSIHGVHNIDVSWNLTCSVNGNNVTASGYFSHFTATSASRNTYRINLWSAVGSPAPNSCTISNLTATSDDSNHHPLALWEHHPVNFTFGVNAYANTLLGGAIWQNAGKTPAGTDAVICADDTANGNSGTHIQSWKCLSDLAQSWARTSLNQFVRNGVCMTATPGDTVVLAHCYMRNKSSQIWRVYGSPSNPGEITVYSGRHTLCLTAPLPADGTQLTVASCTGAADQQWVAPPYPA